MRVLFIYPDLSSTITHYTGTLSYGVASLAAVLREEGHEVGLLHLIASPREEEFRARVRAARPELVAFSSNSHYARRLRSWTTWAREASGAPVVVGGVHATLAPEEVSALPDVDFTCVGEGEQALAELCRTLESGADPAGIRNLWVRGGVSVVRNAPRPQVQDLDALPDPDFSVFDFGRLYDVRKGIFMYLMSRGCPHSCTYCCQHALRSAAPHSGRSWRFLSPRRAVEQLATLLARHLPEVRLVSFIDAIFFPERAWLEEFAPLYRRRIGLPFACNMRADRLDRESAALLRDLGCRCVRLGVESGDERITSQVLKRGLEAADLRRAFALLREHGMARWSYNMVGLPTETLRSALKTVVLNAELDPEFAITFIFYPYPGTALRALCAASGQLTGREYDNYGVGVTARLPQFPETDVLFVQRFFRGLIRLYARGMRLPGRWPARWTSVLDATLSSPLFPRAALVRGAEAYRRVRHRAGEHLVRRSPILYRLLGGRDPVWRFREKELAA